MIKAEGIFLHGQIHASNKTRKAETYIFFYNTFAAFMSGKERKKLFDFSALRRVFVYVKPYRLRFFLSVALAIALAAFTPVRPYLIQLTIDKATGKTPHIPGWLNMFLFKNRPEQCSGIHCGNNHFPGCISFY